MGLVIMFKLKYYNLISGILLISAIFWNSELIAQEKSDEQELGEAVQESPQTDEVKKSKSRYADKNIQELYNKGLEHLNHSNSDSALAYLQEIMSRAFDEVDSKLSLAQAYIKVGQYEKALTTLRKAEEKDPERAGIFRLRGQAYADMEKDGQAITAYEKAVSLDSTHVNALNTLAVLYIQQGKYEKAAPLLQSAIEIRPDIAYFYNNLGVAYEGMNKFQRALESFQTTLSIDPTHQKARQNLARVREKSESMTEQL